MEEDPVEEEPLGDWLEVELPLGDWLEVELPLGYWLELPWLEVEPVLWLELLLGELDVEEPVLWLVESGVVLCDGVDHVVGPFCRDLDPGQI